MRSAPRLHLLEPGEPLRGAVEIQQHGAADRGYQNSGAPHRSAPLALRLPECRSLDQILPRTLRLAGDPGVDAGAHERACQVGAGHRATWLQVAAALEQRQIARVGIARDTTLRYFAVVDDRRRDVRASIGVHRREHGLAYHPVPGEVGRPAEEPSDGARLPDLALAGCDLGRCCGERGCVVER